MTRLLLILCGFGLAMSLLVRGGTTLAGHVAASAKPSAAKPAAQSAIMVGESGSGGQVSGAFGETIITRDGSGRFRLTANANGQQVPFLVDTGADKVAITIDTARAIGLYVDPTGFTTVAMGAGGPVTGQHVTIDRLDIGGHSLTAVDAMILDGLGTNLLGQSALSQLGAVEMRGDQMVLR